MFTLTALCQASRARSGQVHALVLEALLHPTGQGPDEWRFGGDALRSTRTALLQRELELGLPGVAIVMDLLAQVEALTALLQRR